MYLKTVYEVMKIKSNLLKTLMKSCVKSKSLLKRVNHIILNWFGHMVRGGKLGKRIYREVVEKGGEISLRSNIEGVKNCI